MKSPVIARNEAIQSVNLGLLRRLAMTAAEARSRKIKIQPVGKTNQLNLKKILRCIASETV